MTELRRAEKLKNEFVAVVSHELRTPLTALRGSLGLLQSGVAGELPAPAHEMVALALKNAERLNLLIDDLLDFEKIESGQMGFEMKSFELKTLLSAAAEINRPYATALGAHLHLEPLPEDLGEARARGDFNRLMQVLANLLSNAAKYTAFGGGVWLSARRAAATAQAVERVRIEVRDEGMGVPEEFVGRLFERFAQADGSTTRRQGGTGLGLAVSRAIIKKHGNRIGYQPPGSGQTGATFFFDLDLAPAP